MARITAIYTKRGAAKKMNIFLDGKLAFDLETRVAAGERPEIGQEVPARVEGLDAQDQFQKCLDAAVRYLSYRPHSQAELKQKLARRGFAASVRDAVIKKLGEQGLVNDTAFAEFWKENRESFRPRSQRLTRFELKQKGIDKEIIDRVVKVIDDEDSAYRAAVARARRLSGADYPSFRRRLGGYLQRRGFNSSVIRRTVERIWHDQKGLSETMSRPGLE